MNSALVKTEHEFLQGYGAFVNQKNSEMNELVNRYVNRSSNVSLLEERIVKLEGVIHDLRNQLYMAEECKENKVKEAMKWKMRGEILEQDKAFLE